MSNADIDFTTFAKTAAISELNKIITEYSDIAANAAKRYPWTSSNPPVVHYMKEIDYWILGADKLNCISKYIYRGFISGYHTIGTKQYIIYYIDEFANIYSAAYYESLTTDLAKVYSRSTTEIVSDTNSTKVKSQAVIDVIRTFTVELDGDLLETEPTVDKFTFASIGLLKHSSKSGNFYLLNSIQQFYTPFTSLTVELLGEIIKSVNKHIELECNSVNARCSRYSSIRYTCAIEAAQVALDRSRVKMMQDFEEQETKLKMHQTYRVKLIDSIKRKFISELQLRSNDLVAREREVIKQETWLVNQKQCLEVAQAKIAQDSEALCAREAKLNDLEYYFRNKEAELDEQEERIERKRDTLHDLEYVAADREEKFKNKYVLYKDVADLYEVLEKSERVMSDIQCQIWPLINLIKDSKKYNDITEIDLCSQMRATNMEITTAIMQLRTELKSAIVAITPVKEDDPYSLDRCYSIEQEESTSCKLPKCNSDGCPDCDSDNELYSGNIPQQYSYDYSNCGDEE